MRRHAVSDAQWARLEPILPKRQRGPESQRGDRLFIDAVLFRAKTGLPWRDLPERFGPWKTVAHKWHKAGFPNGRGGVEFSKFWLGAGCACLRRGFFCSRRSAGAYATSLTASGGRSCANKPVGDSSQVGFGGDLVRWPGRLDVGQFKAEVVEDLVSSLRVLDECDDPHWCAALVAL